MLLTPINLAAIGLLHGYRRWLSPRKGFGCPHRLLTGGRSCSEHGLRVLQRRPIWYFKPLMRRRFARCRAAGLVLARKPTVQRESKDDRKKRRAETKRRRAEREETHWCDCTDIVWCDFGFIDCGIDGGTPDLGIGNLDCTPGCDVCG